MENIVITELKAVCSMLQESTKQGKFYRRMLQDAKEVKVVSLYDLFTPTEIKTLQLLIQPKKHQCYRNAALAVTAIEAITQGEMTAKYCEGKMTVANGAIPIDHAWNKVGNVYVDITSELVLESDIRNTKEQYVCFGEYDWDYVNTINLKNGVYGDIYKETIINELSK